MTDIDAPLMKQIFNLPQRQRKTDIHHHGKADNLRRCLEVTKGIGHGRRLLVGDFGLNPFSSDSTLAA